MRYTASGIITPVVVLWEDNGEEKDDSDWVTDNESVMNDDGECDE